MVAQTSKKASSPDDVYVLYEQALKSMFKGDFKNALAQFESIRQDFPDEMEVLARVEVLSRTCQRRLQKGTDGKSKSAETVFDLGVLHHNNAEYEQALELYHKALKMAGDDAGHIYYAIAATQAQQGDGKEAIANLKKAVQLEEEYRFSALYDPDFNSLAGTESFKKLVED